MTTPNPTTAHPTTPPNAIVATCLSPEAAFADCVCADAAERRAAPFDDA